MMRSTGASAASPSASVASSTPSALTIRSRIYKLLLFCNQLLLMTTGAMMQAVFLRLRMSQERRSGCPINLTLEVLGDKWSLLILRDMIFGGKRHFRQLMRSEESISSNILADRLRLLVEEGLLTKADDPTHKQKALYSLTEMGIALVPVFAQIGAWGRRFLPASEELSIRAELLEKGGPPLWEKFMAELREEHLGIAPVRGSKGKPSVRAGLQAAYEAAAARATPSPRAVKRSASFKRRG
jgi:DNA-binding HxlR family transcriptional regulator